VLRSCAFHGTPRGRGGRGRGRRCGLEPSTPRPIGLESGMQRSGASNNDVIMIFMIYSYLFLFERQKKQLDLI